MARAYGKKQEKVLIKRNGFQKKRKKLNSYNREDLLSFHEFLVRANPDSKVLEHVTARLAR
jgi:hypothetical protein